MHPCIVDFTKGVKVRPPASLRSAGGKKLWGWTVPSPRTNFLRQFRFAQLAALAKAPANVETEI